MSDPSKKFKGDSKDSIKKYDQQSLYYVNERFSSKIQNAIRCISSNAYFKAMKPENKDDKVDIKKYPICKILTFLSKKLFLNFLQLIFLQLILDQNGWKIHDRVILENCKDVKDFMNNTDVCDEHEYHCVLFYLTLISYEAKFCLNERPMMALFQQELNLMINNFTTHFHQWYKHNSAASSKISPKALNKISRQFNNKETTKNYYLMVESIIDISPPYNNSQPDKKQKKKTAQQAPEQRQPERENEQSQNRQLYQEQQIGRLEQVNPGLFNGPSVEGDDFPQLTIQRQNTSVNDGLEGVLERKFQN